MSEEEILDKLIKMLYYTQIANECGLSNNDFDEELKESVGNYLGVLLKKNIEKDYISKDKIREQIKQIKSEEANIYFKEHVVYFLQELLEEE